MHIVAGRRCLGTDLPRLPGHEATAPCAAPAPTPAGGPYPGTVVVVVRGAQ